MADDPFRNTGGGLGDPADEHFAVTKSDTVDFSVVAKALYIGGAGDVAIVSRSDVVVTYVGVPAGAIIPVRCKRVNSTNTTATNIVALY